MLRINRLAIKYLMPPITDNLQQRDPKIPSQRDALPADVGFRIRSFSRPWGFFEKGPRMIMARYLLSNALARVNKNPQTVEKPVQW